MSVHIEEIRKWLYGAPLPVTLSVTLALGGWVYAIAADQKIEKVRAETVARQVDKMDGKLDKLLEAVAELKAEQAADRQFPPPSPRPRYKESR